jgi:uncharacterized membrane protein YgaE (UPF0421/DUF939 family)
MADGNTGAAGWLSLSAFLIPHLAPLFAACLASISRENTLKRSWRSGGEEALANSLVGILATLKMTNKPHHI